MHSQSKFQQLFYGHLQSDCKVFMERQKTQKSLHNTEEEKQSWEAGTTQLQDLLSIYNNQDSVVLAKEQTNR